MIRISTFSEAGGHATNEDAFLVREVVDQPGRWFVCVADGQGGRAGGARAARMACDSIAEGCDPRDADAMVAADPEAGFTTLVAFTVTQDTIQGASCGDSAVFAVCGSGKTAELTALQHKNPPVGSGEAVFVPFEMRLVRPWKVLAMTDGVWKYVGWDRVRGLATRLGGEELLAALQAAARLPRSGQFQDDFTVVLIEAD
jgi:serine/threonine protein phosphatase PrpC